jgi:hypothetical protein
MTWERMMAQQQKETIEQQIEKIEQAAELTDEQLEKASGGTMPMARPRPKSGDPEDGGN